MKSMEIEMDTLNTTMRMIKECCKTKHAVHDCKNHRFFIGLWAGPNFTNNISRIENPMFGMYSKFCLNACKIPFRINESKSSEAMRIKEREKGEKMARKY